MRNLILLVAGLFTLTACVAPPDRPDTVTITIVGLNDVHGQLAAQDDRGGLISVSAYVAALRELRARDGGAVLLIDAGDMWQGTLESNLGEGEAIVAAYNALDVTAATIGNHEFDFGPLGPASTPTSPDHAPRGALRQRAREADFPLLAANLIDNTTDKPVTWENVRPSIMVEAAGVTVGIIGVMTEEALHTTIAANTPGLRVAPLVPTLVREATALRQRGADLIIVAAHAGSHCTAFGNPYDTSSCNMEGEIMQVAEALPVGLIDHIVAGHVHQGIAHVVNGVSITASYSSTRAFSRTDLRVARNDGAVVAREVYPPQPVVFAAGDAYEGIALRGDAAIARIAGDAVEAANAIKNRKLGVTLTAPFELVPDVESALSNLMTEAMLDSFDADIAIHNVFGGIRSGLPAGQLTYGAVYQMFPFDNVVTIHEISGRELRNIVARKAAMRRKPGFAGMRAIVRCGPDGMEVTLRLDDGRVIRDADTLRVIANDFLALGGDDILTPAIPAEGLEINRDLPLTRDTLVQWFETGSTTLDPADFRTHDNPRWQVLDIITDSCAAEGLYSVSRR